MSKFKKIVIIAVLSVSGITGLANNSLISNANAQVEDPGIYCCLGWGTACGKVCTNVPGETEKFF